MQVQLQRVDPPSTVIDAFNDVQRARADQERARNEAESYANDILPRARGDAQRIRQDAEAIKAQTINLAQGEAQNYAAIYKSYSQARDVTAWRLYLESVDAMLRKSSRVILDSSGKGAAPRGALSAAERDQARARAPRRERQMNTKTLGLLGLAAAMIFVGLASVFTVNEGESALIVRLGAPVGVIDKPGLKFKAPFIDTVIVNDSRLLLLEPPAEQVILGDQKRIVAQTYTRFRIVDPLRFYQSLHSLTEARAQLSQVINTAMRREFGRINLPTLLSPRPRQMSCKNPAPR